MNQSRKSFLSLLLLLCFCLAIVPLEGFHQHEQQTTICDESEMHYADHATDCELADFLFPSLLLQQTTASSKLDILLGDLLITTAPSAEFSTSLSLRSRAPPFKA